VTDPDPVKWYTGLYDEHHRRVYAYAVSRAGRQLADEVVSEVFLVAWRKMADVPADPVPWLLAVARNVICSEFRASARQQSLASELRDWASGSVADIADQVSERHAVLRALAALIDDDRELLTLVAWHGLTSSEAARVIGCSTATYFVRLHRARRRLEQAMAAGMASPAVGAVGARQSAAPAQPRQVMAQGERTIR
jgi:RNA polymerase sigma-70 factor, ECF subfamily